MNTINTLSMICVIFELFHLFFYNHILSCTTPIIEIQRATKYLETSVITTAKMMNIVRKNKWISEAMNIEEQDEQLKNFNDSAESAKATRKSLSNSALLLYIKDCPSGALWYLVYTALEIIFWFVITFLAIEVGGIIGIFLVTWNLILGHINEWLYNHDVFNRYWNIFRIADSISNIVIYFIINYYAFLLASS